MASAAFRRTSVSDVANGVVQRELARARALALRESYFRRKPDHAALLALAREWLGIER